VPFGVTSNGHDGPAVLLGRAGASPWTLNIRALAVQIGYVLAIKEPPFLSSPQKQSLCLGIARLCGHALALLRPSATEIELGRVRLPGNSVAHNRAALRKARLRYVSASLSDLVRFITKSGFLDPCCSSALVARSFSRSLLEQLLVSDPVQFWAGSFFGRFGLRLPAY
jgi:hypothetical protein